MSDLHTDGNGIAGLLAEILAVDATTMLRRCRSCGAGGRSAATAPTAAPASCCAARVRRRRAAHRRRREELVLGSGAGPGPHSARGSAGTQARPAYCSRSRVPSMVPVGLGGGVEDEVGVVQAEGLEVDEQVMAVGQREVNAADLRVALEDSGAHALQGELDRGAVVVAEGLEQRVAHSGPTGAEAVIDVSKVPARADHGRQDAVIGLGQGREAVAREASPPTPRRWS